MLEQQAPSAKCSCFGDKIALPHMAVFRVLPTSIANLVQICLLQQFNIVSFAGSVDAVHVFCFFLPFTYLTFNSLNHASASSTRKAKLVTIDILLQSAHKFVGQLEDSSSFENDVYFMQFYVL